MADVRPLNSLRYDLEKVGALADVVSPPYDVIDAALREELLGRSPFNVVEVDLPQPYEEIGRGEGDPYARAAETVAAWKAEGALIDDPEPALWALTQDYTAPDGSTNTRHGILARVRVE
ncbi:MAG TPA: DUF1015 family protein, partial [Solirubrobacterales bacterium]|nr:DUF1015 family protein [Solirubrobacterales bacterium]